MPPHAKRSRPQLLRAGVVAVALSVGLGPPLVELPLAHAQTSTTGAIQGVITDSKTGERIAGATIVVSNSATAQTAISEDDGTYRITGLAPGEYTITIYFGEQVTTRKVRVSVGKVTPGFVKIDTTAAVQETIVINDHPPVIDVTTIRTGITITADYTKNIPIPGRSFSAVLGTASGSQGVPLGVSFSGATSVSNTFPVSGSFIAATIDEAFSTEAYARLKDNPFLRVGASPLSTFSIDVDTASYANLRRFVREGTRPPPDAIRTEELLNYFRYDDPLPTGATPFAVHTELGPSPWHDGMQVLRVALRSRPIADADVPARNLVFLLDVSGSMSDPNKLPLLQQAMGLVVDQLRQKDQVAIVVYAGSEGVALPTTSGAHKPDIRAALAALQPGGSTNGAAGINRAYELARASFIKGGINRVILCTDGDFNVGVTSEGDLTRLIEDQRKHGVYLSVLGFGMGNLKDSTMEALAGRGNGNYAYIDSLAEARKVLVTEGGATLVTAADDVKLQVEFNPAQIAGYRLIGYEDRLLADRDFADDAKDAGELGAGHAVTALYELVPAGATVPGPAAEPLKYQAPAATGTSAELLTIKVRHKAPGGKTSLLTSYPVSGAPRALARTSDDFRWSLAIAGFGMLLRDAPERGTVTWDAIESLAKGAVGKDAEGYRREALTVITGARALTP